MNPPNWFLFSPLPLHVHDSETLISKQSTKSPQMLWWRPWLCRDHSLLQEEPVRGEDWLCNWHPVRLGTESHVITGGCASLRSRVPREHPTPWLLLMLFPPRCRAICPSERAPWWSVPTVVRKCVCCCDVHMASSESPLGGVDWVGRGEARLSSYLMLYLSDSYIFFFLPLVSRSL